MPFTLPLSSKDGQISVLQLTDLHLFAKEDASLLGVDTASSFQAVVETIVQQQLHYDFIIVTGDISQDYSAESYKRFATIIRPLMGHVFFLPGNHDDGPLMYRMLGHYGVNISRHVICGNWQFVFLNSEVYGVPHGWLQREELDYLQRCVEYNPDLNTVVCVHHLPLLVGSDWLDTQTMHNQDEFNAFLMRINGNHKIKLVLTGHVHQEIDVKQNGIRYIASPSTSIQFEPRSRDFALDLKGPGYRTIQFTQQGQIQTSVFRLPPGRFVPDTSIGGY